MNKRKIRIRKVDELWVVQVPRVGFVFPGNELQTVYASGQHRLALKFVDGFLRRTTKNG